MKETMNINAELLDFQALNATIRETDEKEIVIENCMGQRYIGAGLSGRQIRIHGTPGNALGAYMDGSVITVEGNAQDAVGDTMNQGSIIIHGSAGDAAGYAMRGGRILVKGNIGYRAGIHMKAYRDKVPVLVAGGRAGSFLGEYQAGGLIIVLNIGGGSEAPVGYFCGTGMHGGKIFLCCSEAPGDLPAQVCAKKAGAEELAEIAPHVKAFCDAFGYDYQALMSRDYMVLTPDTSNPYRRLYTAN